MPKPAISNDNKQEFLTLLKNKTNKEIAKHFNCSEGTVEKYCRVFKVKKGHRLFSLNEDYFEQIDSHEKSYILGFMFSDGNVSNQNQVGWIIKEKDIEVLEFCKKAISYGGEIKRYKSLEAKEAVCLKVTSEKMSNDLKKLGCTENKSLTLEWPTFLEDTPFIWSFLLGYLDGDGWVCFRKRGYEVGVACSIPFYYGIKKFMDKNGIRSYRRNHPRGTTVSVAFAGKDGSILSSKLLDSQNFSLKRKREKLEYIKWCYLNLTKENGRLKNFSIGKDLFKSFLVSIEEFEKTADRKRKELFDKQSERAKFSKTLFKKGVVNNTKQNKNQILSHL